MTSVSRVVIGALSAGVLSCADGDGAEAVATLPQSIINGETSSADQDGVLLLRAQLDDGGELLCSSSLVAPNLLVTARHCVSYLSEGQFSCSVRGELFNNPDGGGRLGLHLPAASIEVYGGKTPRQLPLARGQQVISTLSPSICENDLAFVVLDTALNLPLLPLRVGRSADLSEAAVLVGYGMDQNEISIDYRTQTRKQKRDLVIAAVGPDSIADGVTTVPPRTLILNGPAGCIGDSGGPLLSEETGALLGVYSLLAGASCAARSAHHQLVHVPPFEALIDEAFAAADAEPLQEPEPNVGSTAGASHHPDPDLLAGAGGQPNVGSAGFVTDTATTPGPAKRSDCGLTASERDWSASWPPLLLLAATFLRRFGKFMSRP